MNSAILPDDVLPDELIDPSSEPGRESPVPMHVAKHLVSGTSALGLGVLIERGTGFVGNILAARLGGAPVFGAYSLAITTANNISTYAAGGIGATAARFSGKYQRGTAGYATLARVLAIVSVVSALLASLSLWLGAKPLAHLLRKDSLTDLLRWAAFSAAGIILLECARGFFVGQRRLVALVLLSILVGGGMLTILPIAAHAHSPVRMIVSQGAITTGAVLVCLLLARPLGLFSPSLPAAEVAKPVGPMLREVWGFGMVQLAGLIGVNLAGWWLTSLVARADTSLVQMSFFSIASQLRNIVGLAPGLLTESSYSVMAEREGEAPKTPDQVMAVCSYASTVASLLLAALGIIVVPWALTLLYGRIYAAASVTTAVALAIGVVHMGNAPASARLSIVSIRLTGVINTTWAIFVAIAAGLLLLHGGSAAKAMAIYLAAHILSSTLVLIVLSRRGCVLGGVVKVFVIGTATSIALAALAYIRDTHPGQTLSISLLMLALFALSFYTLFVLGRRHRWLPSAESLRRLLAVATAMLRGLGRSKVSA
jgi:O-antigen/teichoic acid export membrane protein